MRARSTTTGATPVQPSPAGRRTATARRPWARAMLGYDAYALAALPVGLAGLAAGPFGGSASLDRAQRVLTRRLLGVPVTEAATPPRRLLRYGLAALPAELVSFALLGPAWALFLTRGVLYPVFGADHLDRSWGGPSLAGAWVAHFIQGPPLLFVITLLLWPVRRYQVRLARGHFGA